MAPPRRKNEKKPVGLNHHFKDFRQLWMLLDRVDSCIQGSLAEKKIAIGVDEILDKNPLLALQVAEDNTKTNCIRGRAAAVYIERDPRFAVELIHYPVKEIRLGAVLGLHLARLERPIKSKSISHARIDILLEKFESDVSGLVRQIAKEIREGMRSEE